jgi:uncharacterized protein (DUF2147 family)
MKKRMALFILTAISFCFDAQSQNKTEDIIGIWLTAGKEPAKIQIYTVGGKIYGKIIWLKNPTENGKQRLDANNPDKEKRGNPIIGLVMLKGFKFDGDDEWKGGDIYDPENGKTYNSYMYLKGKNVLKVRGYVGISLLGRTETWTRSE